MPVSIAACEGKVHGAFTYAWSKTIPLESESDFKNGVVSSVGLYTLVCFAPKVSIEIKMMLQLGQRGFLEAVNSMRKSSDARAATTSIAEKSSFFIILRNTRTSYLKAY